jgi:hypothetical protein
MANAPRYDHELSLAELDPVLPFDFDLEPAVPAEKELVFVVVVPRELALESSDPERSIIDGDEVFGLPRAFEAIGLVLNGQSLQRLTHARMVVGC